MLYSLLILSLVLALILLVPMVCRKVHVPSIVGFILAGVLLGPYGVGWIPESDTIRVLGNLGMLYIMLQAGVELDLNDFSQVKYSSLLYGLYAFFCPFLLGLLTSRLMGFAWTTSALLGAMYGSHTLMTYPIVSRYGVQSSRAVNIVVGGTMVAITLSLLLLAGLKTSLVGTSDAGFWMKMGGKTALFLLVVVGLFPRVAQWWFRRYQEATSGFLLVMVLLCGASFLAEWAGLEAILGAFVSGVALNRFIPNRSPLMERISFVGSSIFVPVFLLGVGMMMDMRIFRGGWPILGVAAVMTATKLAGKWLAAWAAQCTFRLSALERQLIFGLTHATAAGTLAIVTIGYRIGLFTPEILNGAVLMILVLCTISSFVTEYAAKRLALQEEARMEADRVHDEWLLMGLRDEPEEHLQLLSRLSQLHEVTFQVETDWQDVLRSANNSDRSVVVYHAKQPINTVNRILVAVPRYAEKEHDFISCFGLIRRLSSEIGARVVFYACDETRPVLQALSQRKGKALRAGYRDLDDWEDVLMMARDMQPDDLVVLLTARPSTPSYNPLFRQIPRMLDEYFTGHSWLLIYPEQQTHDAEQDVLLMEIPQTAAAWRVISRTKQFLLRLLRSRQVAD